MKSLANKIMKRIQSKGRGFSFTAKDFLDLASRGAVDMALTSLVRLDKVRRVCRGVYDYPRHSKIQNDPLAPDFDQVAHAIARNTGACIQPSCAVAANLLGISKQAPAKIVYLTDGLSRTVKIGSQTIAFKRTCPTEILPNAKSALVVQALRFLGQEAVTPAGIRKLRRDLSPTERKRLLKDAGQTTGWVADVVQRIAKEPIDE